MKEKIIYSMNFIHTDYQMESSQLNFSISQSSQVSRASKVWQILKQPPLIYISQTSHKSQPRVAKCHGYGGYIRVKKLEGWGKKFGRMFTLAKSGDILCKFEQLI